MRAYVDGLNLYHGLLKGKKNRRWLDLEALASSLMPQGDLVGVRYFTARVKDFKGNGAPQRQDVYLQALATLRRVSIHYGTFRVDPKMRKLTEPQPDGSEYVSVLIPEEKGSDVNLASYLLVDGFRDLYDIALVVTNDSDLAEPVRLVGSELGKSVVLAHPSQAAAGHLLRAGPSRVLRIHVNTILKSQLPDPVVRADGSPIHRPHAW